jgi:NhaP-type Na+/H+ or K+/H+ antiporter
MWVVTVTLALAGAFLIATTAVWVTVNADQPPPAQETPRGHAIAAVLTAPDATMISALVRTRGHRHRGHVPP